jgi:hypothetical protein
MQFDTQAVETASVDDEEKALTRDETGTAAIILAAS